MTRARKTLICLQDTPYYHVVARCVRRAWLWGFDAYANRDHSHRKGWILERMRTLAEVFAIDVCAYAVMSNHYHLVLHVDQRRAGAWARLDVVKQWTKIFSPPTLVDRWVKGECNSEAEREAAEAIIELWRQRLCDVSWYMRALNEHLARRANAEDGCTGRFWEGRFKSQALLDEAGLLTAMVYVDLNPIRAGVAGSPEESDFTSIQARIQSHFASLPTRARSKHKANVSASPVRLLRFADAADDRARIPFRTLDYFQLVDWTGRVVRNDKKGAMESSLPPLMQRLNIDSSAWQEAMAPGGNVFGRAIGRLDHLRLHANAIKQSWIRGQGAAMRLYPSRG